MSLTMAQAYEAYGDEDGFLYITYASQEVFGYQDGKLHLAVIYKFRSTHTDTHAQTRAHLIFTN